MAESNCTLPLADIQPPYSPRTKMSDEILHQGCFLGCFVGDCKLVSDNIRRRYCRRDVGSAQRALNVLWKMKPLEFSPSRFTDFVCWQWPHERTRSTGMQDLTVTWKLKKKVLDLRPDVNFNYFCRSIYLYRFPTSHFMVVSTTCIRQQNDSNSIIIIGSKYFAKLFTCFDKSFGCIRETQTYGNDYLYNAK